MWVVVLFEDDEIVAITADFDDNSEEQARRFAGEWQGKDFSRSTHVLKATSYKNFPQMT